MAFYNTKQIISYPPAKDEEAEKGNCSNDMQRLAIRKLHRRTPEKQKIFLSQSQPKEMKITINRE